MGELEGLKRWVGTCQSIGLTGGDGVGNKNCGGLKGMVFHIVSTKILANVELKRAHESQFKNNIQLTFSHSLVISLNHGR